MLGQTVFFKYGYTNIFVPSHRLFLRDRHFFNWEIMFSPFKSGRVVVIVLTNRVQQKWCPLTSKARSQKEYSCHLGSLSFSFSFSFPLSFLEPSDHVETTSDTSINYQTAWMSHHTIPAFSLWVFQWRPQTSWSKNKLPPLVLSEFLTQMRNNKWSLF